MSQTVFITGASSGIGHALARANAARSPGSRRSVPSEMPALATTTSGTPASAMKASAAARMPDVVVANAGISEGTDLREPGDLAAFARVMDTNWMGTLNTFQPFVEPMLARAKPGQPGGTLVGIASVAGVRGLPGAAAYSASKSAVIKLMESLRVEFGPLGLRVVTIAPGYIRTPMTAHNPYPMPFLMPVDVFAQKAVEAIHRGVRFTVLPWQMGIVAKLLHVLPRWLYDLAFARAPRKPRKPEISS